MHNILICNIFILSFDIVYQISRFFNNIFFINNINIFVLAFNFFFRSAKYVWVFVICKAFDGILLDSWLSIVSAIIFYVTTENTDSFFLKIPNISKICHMWSYLSLQNFVKCQRKNF